MERKNVRAYPSIRLCYIQQSNKSQAQLLPEVFPVVLSMWKTEKTEVESLDIWVGIVGRPFDGVDGFNYTSVPSTKLTDRPWYSYLIHS